MFTKSQSDRIARRCTTAIVDAIDAFPALLAQCEPESAAQIIADLIKVQLNRPQPEEDPSSALCELIRLGQAAENQD